MRMGKRCPGEYIWGGGGNGKEVPGLVHMGRGRRCPGEYVWGGRKGLGEGVPR